ncbi:hypothetical protein [Microbacterium sp. A84]|uniref:hypothetical protein n=1 Tax=Microbacterium sp. A84 TaxID=3450715 RepID=UPI003F41F2C0
MKRALPWLTGAALVLVAGVITAITPAQESVDDAFLVRGGTGETVTSRTLTAAIDDVFFTEHLAVPESDWQAEGNWLVVTVTASAPLTEVDAAISLATLVIDGRVFQASERPSTSLVGERLHVGIDTVGVLAFELPSDLRTGDAELRLTIDNFTPRLDDLIAIPITLDDLPVVARTDVDAPVLGAP